MTIRTTIRAFVISLALLAVPGAALAADAKGNYVILGAGTYKCSQWVDARRIETPDVVEMESWLMGYITATNAWRSNTTSVSGAMIPAQLYGWMDGYCKDNLQETLGNAASQLVTALDYLMQQKKAP
jgi:hypothetical protein